MTSIFNRRNLKKLDPLENRNIQNMPDPSLTDPFKKSQLVPNNEFNLKNMSSKEKKPESIENQDNLMQSDLMKNEELGMIRNVSNLDHKYYINDPHIRKCFPLLERGLLRASRLIKCGCGKFEYSFVDSLLKQNIIFSEQEKEDLKYKCALINILESSNLELDPNVMHPFVKMHLVDISSGNYIRKTKNRPILSYYESLTHFNKLNKKFTQGICDLIYPVSTNFYDLRENGQSRALWNEDIYIDEDAEILFQPNIILLFEVLDFNKILIKEKKYDLINQDLFYRVAWGFLRPVGIGRNHFGISKIQLYRYKFDQFKTNAHSLHSSIPYVYYDFIWPYKTEYPGYISVQVLAQEKPPYVQTIHPPRSVFEQEKGEDITKTLNHIHKEDIPMDDLLIEKDKILLKRRRLLNEQCQIPNKILYKFQTSQLGCMRLLFSHNGKYLAAACTQENSKTIIKIFDMEDGTLPFILKGHRNIIHDLDWSLNDRFLISASSDYSAIIWKIPKSSDEAFEEDESEKRSILYEIKHPSYVYGAKIMPENIKMKRLIIATICFDGKVRIWMVEYRDREIYDHNELLGESFISLDEENYEMYTNLLDHRHPNTLVFNETGRLHIGDSLGIVHIYDIKIKFKKFLINKIRTITHSEIEGDPINNIYFRPPENNNLIIHSRDNCIRSFEDNETGQKIQARFFGSKSSRFSIKSTISPDGNYILSGSEDGKPCLWNFDNKEVCNTEVFQLSFMDSVSDVTWSEDYHMIACAGFGKDYPILVYCWERGEEFGINDYKLLIENIKKQKEEEIDESYDIKNFGDEKENVRPEFNQINNKEVSKGIFKRRRKI